MRRSRFHNVTARITMLLLLGASVHAASVSDWHTFKAAPATTLAGQGTDDPIMGSLSATADAAVLIGYFSPLTLTDPGDTLALRFTVSFNDAIGMANAGDNFRFALFDLNGQSPVTAENSDTAGVDGQTDDWRGYWFGVRNGSGTGSGGSMRKRIAPLSSGDNPFAATGANSGTVQSLGAVGGDPVTLQSSVNGDGSGALYTGQLILSLTTIGVDLSGSFSGTNSPNINLFSAADSGIPFPTTFGAVGFLNGDALNADEVIFQNVTVTLTPVPEPGGILLASAGLITLTSRRSRRL